MRRIKAKQPKSVQPETFFESKRKMTIAGATVLAVLLIISVLIYMESTDNKIVIKNKSDLKLEYVKAFYVGPEEAYNEGINITELTPGNTVSLPQETIDLLGAEANLEIRFKFEGYDELFVDAGYFNDIFSGKTTINFIPTDEDKIQLTVKAKNGIITSNLINCDEEYTINLTEGFIED